MEPSSSAELTRQECDRFLAGTALARLATTRGAMPAIFPVRYALLEGDPVFRAAQDGPLHRAGVEQILCLEIDEVGGPGQPGWTVMVIGKGQAVVDEATLAACRLLHLQSWSVAPEHDVFVRLSATVVTGHRDFGP